MALGETDHQDLFLGLAWGFYGFALLVCLARFYVRFFMIRIPGADDYLLMGTIAATTGMLILLTFQSKFALGRHTWNVTLPDFEQALKCYYGAVLCYMVGIASVKITIVVQYLRIFRVFPIICYICWGVFVFLILWLLGTLLAIIAFCKVPGVVAWSPESVGSKCAVTTWLVHAGISIGTDWFMILLPIPVVWHMRNPPKQRVAVCVLFAIGGAACIMSCVRVVSLRDITPTADPAYDTIWTSLWTALEMDIAMICASLMAIRPLLLRWIPTLRREAQAVSLPPLNHIPDGPDPAPAPEMGGAGRRDKKIKTAIAKLSGSFRSSRGDRDGNDGTPLGGRGRADSVFFGLNLNANAGGNVIGNKNGNLNDTTRDEGAGNGNRQAMANGDGGRERAGLFGFGRREAPPRDREWELRTV